MPPEVSIRRFARHPLFLRLGALALVAALLVGCVNPDRMFSGRWTSIDPVAFAGFAGYPELGIGHFGPDLVGVMRLWDRSGTPHDDCSCTIMEARSVRTSAGSFTATAPFCEDGTLFVALTIDTSPDVPRLVGTLTHTPPSGGAPVSVDVVFEQADTSVDEDFKACGL